MASLAEREGLRGKVQCIYIDPPYGIKFNSNFQWSTTSRDVKDGNVNHITREPEQVKAFRDTWRDGIHSYLTYLRDRLEVAKELLSETGSIFVQIGDENVHRIRDLMDEVFGEDNFIHIITIKKTAGLSKESISGVTDFLLWYAKDGNQVTIHRGFEPKPELGDNAYAFIELPDLARRRMTKKERMGSTPLSREAKIFRYQIAVAAGLTPSCVFEQKLDGVNYKPKQGSSWKSNRQGMARLDLANRIEGNNKTISYIRYQNDFPVNPISNLWADTASGSGMDKIFVVQTNSKVVERCLIMTTNPGDLVLDPTCGSGTTAYVAEQWGRRWITIDTSRVALALARARIMGARYPYYILADSKDGQLKEAEIKRTSPSEMPTHNNIRHGFVYERVPHITLKSIANNAEIDVIWEKYQEKLEPLREKLNQALGKNWEEWEIPREAGDPWDSDTRQVFRRLKAEIKKGEAADKAAINKHLQAINHTLKRSYTLETLPKRPVDPWSEEVTQIHAQWWEQRIARQKEIDASIAAKADSEFLYDKPYVDTRKVRVAGPFTVESLSPHRVLGVDEKDELIDGVSDDKTGYGEEWDFTKVILENLKTAGVQQAHKEDKIDFTSIIPWPGEMVCAEGRYIEGREDSGIEKRAAIFIGPEFGTVSRPDLVAAAREAGDADFDVLIACAFSYDAHSSEFKKLGRIPVLKARMNADLHMSDDLKNTGKGNLFVIFGEPDIDILDAGENQIQVKINGVDVFHPNTGEIRSDNADGIACWFIDTNYNEESFFVRHAYFLGANDPYKSLKTTLKAQINKEAWETLHSDTSRPFDKPESGRIAVKVINHLGDEVMKVFKV
ncbi:MAG: site-specific DNA-methyltransferase [Candidatus Lokiarchaeota archaeon]|nr:site-specific DNA-methyltransferase [Candidatus Lokiarchaeota archaeon]